jgi:hypothetical protein
MHGRTTKKEKSIAKLERRKRKRRAKIADQVNLVLKKPNGGTYLTALRWLN